MRKLEILTAALASLLIFIMPATAAWNFDGMGGVPLLLPFKPEYERNIME